MANSVPTLNQWYQNIADKRLFEVIAVDEYTALIDIRYAEPCYEYGAYSGGSDENCDLDVLSFDEWSQMVVVAARPPQDWRSAIGWDTNLRMLGDNIVMPSPEGSTMDTIEAADYLFGWDEF
jgi:hypothetical protein